MSTATWTVISLVGEGLAESSSQVSFSRCPILLQLQPLSIHRCRSQISILSPNFQRTDLRHRQECFLFQPLIFSLENIHLWLLIFLGRKRLPVMSFGNDLCASSLSAASEACLIILKWPSSGDYSHRVSMVRWKLLSENDLFVSLELACPTASTFEISWWKMGTCPGGTSFEVCMMLKRERKEELEWGKLTF